MFDHLNMVQSYCLLPVNIRLCGKGKLRSYGTEFPDQLTLRYEDYSRLSECVQCNYRDPYKWKKET